MSDPREMALTLQLLGKKGGEFGAAKFSLKDSGVEFITAEDPIHRISDAARFLHVRPSAEGHFTCVLDNGERYFLKKRIPKSLESLTSGSSTNLLSKSMTDLLHEAHAKQVASKTLHMTRERAKQLQKLNFSPFVAGMDDGEKGGGDGDGRGQGLWVDKYTPKVFSQLLSPEHINRDVLRSLKDWDHFVFKKPKAPVTVNEALSPSKAAAGSSSRSGASCIHRLC